MEKQLEKLEELKQRLEGLLVEGAFDDRTRKEQVDKVEAEMEGFNIEAALNFAERLIWNRENLLVFQPLASPAAPKISFGVPKGSRTPVAGVKGRSPGPLDDGDT